MADNTAQNGTATIAADDIGAGLLVQRVKIGSGADGSFSDATATTPIPTTPGRSTTGTITSVSASATSVTLLAANTSRLGATIYNDSTVDLYLALAATASTTAFTIKINTNGYYELPREGVIYTGIITGIWASASGSARVTELT